MQVLQFIYTTETRYYFEIPLTETLLIKSSIFLLYIYTAPLEALHIKTVYCIKQLLNLAQFCIWISFVPTSAAAEAAIADTITEIGINMRL